jgi:hypothetical protein
MSKLQLIRKFILNLIKYPNNSIFLSRHLIKFPFPNNQLAFMISLSVISKCCAEDDNLFSGFVENE